MKKTLLAMTIVLLLLVSPAGAGYSAHAAAEDQLGMPFREIPFGTFGGIAYKQYDGIFEGQTSTGTYRVPYRIIAPADPARANRTVIVEPPHIAEGLGTLKIHLGKEFLLSRGFAYAGVGYSTTSFTIFGEIFNFRILDPSVPDVFIHGGFEDEGGRTDDEIIADFASALETDSIAQGILGGVDRRYLTGFSDSSAPVLRLITSGLAAGVFDFAFPFTAPTIVDESDPCTIAGFDPQRTISDGLYSGKLIIVNSESEGPSIEFVDRGNNSNQYRFYAVAGAPHAPDPLDPLAPPFLSMRSPASFQPALRAHFLQGDTWARGGKQLLSSTHLKSSDCLTLDRDANGNAIAIDAKGKPVARLPFVELGEARFTDDEFHFLGIYDNVKTISELGFSDHAKYLKAFEKALKAYIKAGFMLQEDADVMLRRATLCPEKTFTEVYRDAYENFVAVLPCP